MWEKIVLNLLSNAFKFTFEGGITRARCAADGGGAELRVSDTGTGIPAGELPRLFERFHRVEGQQGRSHEGSGIGLALVQELVRLHGGTIAVESEVGRGTTFAVTLPFGSAHLPAERVGGRARPAPTATRAGGLRRGGAALAARRGARGGVAAARDGGRRRRRRRPTGARRSCWRTTTRTCATTSPACWRAGWEVEAVADGGRRSRPRGAAGPTSCWPT